VIVPKGYVLSTLFVEHYILVMATLLVDMHGITEELFETLEELEANKRHMNARASDNIRFAFPFVHSIQIQINAYALLVKRGRRIKYPIFSTIVPSVLIDEYLLTPLPENLEQHLFPRPSGAAPPASATSRGTPAANTPPMAGQRRISQKHNHPHPNQPWKVEGRLKLCMEAASAAGVSIPLMDSGHPACLTFQFKFIHDLNCTGHVRSNSHNVLSRTEFN